MKTPKIKAPQLKLLPEGDHQAKILGFDRLVLSQTRPGLFRMAIRLDVGGQVVCTFAFGYPVAMQALFASRSFWEGETVPIRCRHRNWDGLVRADIDVLKWEKVDA